MDEAKSKLETLYNSLNALTASDKLSDAALANMRVVIEVIEE